MRTNSISKKILASLLAAVSVLSCRPMAAYADDMELSLGGTSASLTQVGGARLQDGVYIISCCSDVLMCLNNQYRRTDGGLVLDNLNYEDNELWILKNTDSGYFTLSPYYAPGYCIAGQDWDCQLFLTKGGASDYNNQWKAVPDGDKYVIVNRASGLAMDSAHGGSHTGNAILNYTVNGFRPAQSWTIGRISEFTNRLDPGSIANLSDGYYSILMKDNQRKNLNVQYASTDGNGTAKLCIDTANGEDNEIFYIQRRSGDMYTISPKNAPGVCVNVWAANPVSGPGNQLTLATYAEGDLCSLWIPCQNSDGTISFMNARTRLFMNAYLNSATDGSPVVAHYFDDTSAGRWHVRSAGSSGGSNAGSSAGYAGYGGVNYRALTSDSRRIAACDKAVQMATILWTSPCTFPAWKSSGGAYNTVTATDGSSATKFIAGKTYQGIPYSMAGRTYDDVKWASLVKSGMTTSSMTGKYYTSRADTTAKGIDCSYLVCTALNAGCGTSINLNTASMLSSSKFQKISRSGMLPGDIFLKSGHVMLFLGRTSGGKYAVIEANASYSRVVYRELSSSSLSAYGSYRYTGF